MSRKERFSCEEKEKAVIDYIDGNRTRAQICKDLNISKRTIQDWAGIYNKHGIAGFQRKRKNSSYSKEFKLKIIKEYQDGDGSLLAPGRNDHSESGEINQFQPLENSQCTSATPFLS